MAGMQIVYKTSCKCIWGFSSLAAKTVEWGRVEKYKSHPPTKLLQRLTQNKRRVAWLLLIVDGYGSHSTIPFIIYQVTKSKIILFCLPPHSTHLPQPLDVGIFQPFKHYHPSAIDKAVRLRPWKIWQTWVFGHVSIISQPNVQVNHDSPSFQVDRPSALCSRRRHPWQSPRVTNCESGDCPSNSFSFSPPSIARTQSP